MSPNGRAAFAGFSSDLIMPGRLIPPSSGFTTFSHQTNGDLAQFIEQNFRFNYNPDGKYVIAVTYESVYGTVWTIRSDSYARIPVK
ncbi:MAG: hypothetical protein HKN76_12280 [Saprospiraceae bacterium]|nr:hypothetical protein [Saprospiraceae bacterium]